MLFMTGQKKLTCVQCGSILKTDKLKMIPYALVIGVLSALFALTYVSTGLSVKWLVITIIYFIIVFFTNPFFVKLKVIENKKV